MSKFQSKKYFIRGLNKKEKLDYLLEKEKVLEEKLLEIQHKYIYTKSIFDSHTIRETEFKLEIIKIMIKKLRGKIEFWEKV